MVGLNYPKLLWAEMGNEGRIRQGLMLAGYAAWTCELRSCGRLRLIVTGYSIFQFDFF